MIKNIVVPVVTNISARHSHVTVKSFISLLIVMGVISLICLAVVYFKLKLKKKDVKLGHHYINTKYFDYLKWDDNILFIAPSFCSIAMVILLVIYYFTNLVYSLI